MKNKKSKTKSLILNKVIDATVNMSSENFVLVLFIFVDLAFLLKFIGGNAWMTVVFLFIATCILSFKLHNILVSFILMTVYSLQFYVPNKYYIIQVFSSHELLNGVGSYLLSYGINIKNIFLLLALTILIRNLFFKKSRPSTKRIIPTIPVIISGLIYFLVSLYSLLRFSPYPELSIVWLIHYMQMFFLGLAILYLNILDIKNIKLITPVILSSIFLESIISIMQFIRQNWAGLPIESAKFSSVYYGASDAVSSIFRVAGTFGQSNQFGLVMLIMLIIILPHTFEGRKTFYILGSILCIIMMLLTQSRSVWISFIGVSLIALKFYKKEIQLFIYAFGVRRLLISIAVILISTSIVVIPRVVASVNAFTDEGGATLRSEMLKEASIAIQQNLWIGYGIGTNEIVLHKLFPTGYTNWFPAPVHIAYIQIVLESGILGLLSFLFPFVYIIRNIVNNYLHKINKFSSEYKEYVFITLSGILGFGLFYLFQPHEGTRDFYYLGVILGYGLICLTTKGVNKNEI